MSRSHAIDVVTQHHIYHEFFSKTHTACHHATGLEFLVLDNLELYQLQQITKQFNSSTVHKCHSTIHASCQFMSPYTKEPWCEYHSQRNIICSGQWCKARFASYLDDDELTAMFAEMDITYTTPSVASLQQESPLHTEEDNGVSSPSDTYEEEPTWSSDVHLEEMDEVSVILRPVRKRRLRRRRKSTQSVDSGYDSDIIPLNSLVCEKDSNVLTCAVTEDLSHEELELASVPISTLVSGQQSEDSNVSGLLKTISDPRPPMGKREISSSQLAIRPFGKRTYKEVAAGVSAVSEKSSDDFDVVRKSQLTRPHGQYGYDTG